MTLHYLILTAYSDRIDFQDNPINAIERAKVYELDLPDKWSMNPTVLQKEMLMGIIVNRKLPYTFAIYCKSTDLEEAKEKLITELNIKLQATITDMQGRIDLLAKTKLEDNGNREEH